MASPPIPVFPAATTLRPPMTLPLTWAKNLDGTTLSATAASGKFGISSNAGADIGTDGGTINLVASVANASTATAAAMIEFALPNESYEGDVVPLNVAVKLDLATGAEGTCTLKADVNELSMAGATISTLCTGGPFVLDAAAACTNFAFDVDTTLVSPGDRVLVRVGLTLVETGTADMTGSITSIRFG